MLRALGIAAFAALAGCQTLGEVSGGSALSGQELDTAVGLYGPWAEYLVLDGKRTYVWRRHYVAEDKPYFCELRVEMGFRRTISTSTLQGYPDACRLFAVRYRTANN
ncbi:hypothetical protein [Phenylobacterium sp.]|uniref:hypothetical protein n=1 Tax=Phenylobacterium sp. TaxID=1871053 RepID=UPI002FE2504C